MNPRKIWVIGAIAVVAGGAAAGVVVVARGGTSPNHPAYPRPSVEQVGQLERAVTSGQPQQVAGAFAGLSAYDLPSGLVSQLQAIDDLRVQPGSIRGVGDGVATATLVGIADGKQVSDKVIFVRVGDRWLISTGTS